MQKNSIFHYWKNSETPQVPGSDKNAPWAVHERQGGDVAPREAEEHGAHPVRRVPVEQDGPQALHPVGPVVAEEEEGDEEGPGHHGDEQPLGGRLKQSGWVLDVAIECNEPSKINPLVQRVQKNKIR